MRVLSHHQRKPSPPQCPLPLGPAVRGQIVTSHACSSSASVTLGKSERLPCLPLWVERARGVNPALLGVRVRQVEATHC